MYKKNVLLVLIAFLSLIYSNAQTDKPNVLFIICDDLNDAVEGMGGHPQAITPNMDKLAKMGVRFTNAQCNVPICGPSRASLWSGLYPHTTGYYGYKQQQNHWRRNPVLKNSVTLLEHMTNDGYKVYATGKIHHNGHEDWSIFKDKKGKSGFNVRSSMGPYPSGTKEDYKGRGKSHPDMPKDIKGWDSSFGPVRNISDSFNGSGHWKYTFGSDKTYKYVSEEDRDLMADEKSVVYAKTILKKEHDKPFMLAVGFNRPHTPLYVPEKYFNMYGLDTLKVARVKENDLEDCSKILYKDHNLGTKNYGYHKYNQVNDSCDKEALKKWTQAYLACVTFVDDQSGSLLNAIENSAYAKNTLIVFTSDHGYHMGEKQQLFKNSVWEESTRVPLIIAGPGVKQSAECEVPVSLIDFYPTVVDYCGLSEHPNKDTNAKELDGFSLRELLAKPQKNKWKGPEIAISAVASNKPLEINQPGAAVDQNFSVRSKQYRYVICSNGEEELYDHYVDPFEWNNLVGIPEYKKVKEKLNKQFQNSVLKKVN